MDKRLTLSAAALLLSAIGLVPILVMVANSLDVDGRLSIAAYRRLWVDRHLVDLIGHSLLLSLYTTVAAIVVGVPLGILLGKTDLPYRRGLVVLLTVPLVLPPFVIAVAWSSVLRPGGWLGHSMAEQTARSLSAALFGLPGCVGVLFTAFMPVIMLLTIAYLGTVNPRLEDAGRLVAGWAGVLRRITLPMIAPSILLSAMLVFLLTFGEVGAPSYLRYSVYPVEVLTEFAAFYDFSAATAAAVPMLIVTLMVMGTEYWLVRGRGWETSAETFAGVRARIELKNWRFPLFVIALAWALATVMAPLAALAIQSFSSSAYAEALSRAGDSILRSITLAAIGATALTTLGFFCGYLIHDRAWPLWRGIDALGLFLFTLPGTVIGVGLISLWNTPLTNFIYRGPAILILGYLAQYTVLPARVTAATLERIPVTLEFAAQVSGASWFMTVRHVVAPLARPGLVVAWVASYIFCLRDLGVSMVVYPPGSDTLPVRILTLMANGTPGLIAALCMILIAITLFPLSLAMLWQTRTAT